MFVGVSKINLSEFTGLKEFSTKNPISIETLEIVAMEIIVPLETCVTFFSCAQEMIGY